MNAVPGPSSLDIASFLPLGRMAEIEAAGIESYAAARPFPHLVFDNFFAPDVLDRVLAEFPQPGAINWQKFDNEREIKLAAATEAAFGPNTRLLLYHLNSMTFLSFLSRITGIPDLIPDPGFEGGGLHQIVPGGKLGIHADFNKHRRYGLDRRLNVLVYLNKNWREEYGGHLELWDREMKGCEARILPVFNRLALFGTRSDTFHGHPDPLRCPEGMTRKSLALYYFTNGRPADEINERHSTVFRERSPEDFRPTAGQRARSLLRDCLPPIITRKLKGLIQG